MHRYHHHFKLECRMNPIKKAAFVIISVIASVANADPGHVGGEFVQTSGHIESLSKTQLRLKTEEGVLDVMLKSSTKVKKGRSDKKAELAPGNYVTISAIENKDQSVTAYEIFVYPSDGIDKHMK